MALSIVIVAGLVVAGLGLVGYLRDIRRGVLALVGTLLGALLVDFWAEAWGQGLAGRLGGGNPQTLTLLISCTIFVLTALLVGYGGGGLLGPARERMTLGRRAASVMLGVLNGVLIVGYVLRFLTAANQDFAAQVKGDIVARTLHEGPPILFLVAAVAVASAVLVRGLFTLIGGRRPQPPLPMGFPARSSPMPMMPPVVGKPPITPPPSQQDRQRDLLGKIERNM